MEYVAVGISEAYMAKRLESLNQIAEKHDLKLLVKPDSDIDSEVKEGVIDFASLYRLMLIQVIRLSTEKQEKTSSGVTDNLFDFNFGNAEPHLVNFLIDAKAILPKSYHLIFAFEWHKGDRVMYKELPLSRLREYFTDNCSWPFRLYDYEKCEYGLDLDIPLIFEIKNA
jgi:hypothetical protein